MVYEQGLGIPRFGIEGLLVEAGELWLAVNNFDNSNVAEVPWLPSFSTWLILVNTW